MNESNEMGINPDYLWKGIQGHDSWRHPIWGTGNDQKWTGWDTSRI